MTTAYFGWTEPQERIEARKRRILSGYQPEPATIWQIGADVFAVVGKHDAEDEEEQ